MNKIRCLVVDDEAPAIQLLEKYISMTEQLVLVGTSNSAVKAFDLLKENEIDLLFLDIQMPVLNGIDFIKSLKRVPAVILTTAYREYALEGYELNVLDYLLKPIAFNRFLKAIDKYEQPKLATQVSTELHSKPDYIFVTVNRMHHKVWLDDIHYLESLKDYTRIHTTQDRLVVKGNLGTTLDLLPKARFLRIHRSYAVALSKVTAYNKTELAIGSLKLPIGASYRDSFAQCFE